MRLPADVITFYNIMHMVVCESVIFYSFGGQKALCSTHTLMIMREVIECAGVARLLFVCRTFGAACLIANCPIALRQQRPRGYYILYLLRHYMSLIFAVARRRRQNGSSCKITMTFSISNMYMYALEARRQRSFCIPRLRMRIWIMCITWGIRLVSANLMPLTTFLSMPQGTHSELNKHTNCSHWHLFILRKCFGLICSYIFTSFPFSLEILWSDAGDWERICSRKPFCARTLCLFVIKCA